MATCESESVKMLSELAKEHGVWLIGGALDCCCLPTQGL